MKWAGFNAGLKRPAAVDIARRRAPACPGAGGHAYRLQEKGAHIVERETFEAGLMLGEKALRALGLPHEQAARATGSFRKHDEEMVASLAQAWGDEERYAVAFRESSERMNQLLMADLQQSAAREADGGTPYPVDDDDAASGEEPDRVKSG